MLIKSTSYQVFFNGIIRIIGFFTTALLFRIYSIEEMGEYFLLIRREKGAFKFNNKNK